MECRFCQSPAAHPATGTQYTEKFVACRDCTVRFNTWMLAHVNGKGRGKKHRANVQTALSFYEAAALFPSTRRSL